VQTVLASPTRTRVARLLLERGPQTAAVLAAELDMTPAGVRRHLDGMVERGEVVTREQRPTGSRGRGRPARVYLVSDTGRALTGQQGYDEVAAAALRFLAEREGAEALTAFAEQRATQLEQRWAGVADVAGLAAAMTRDGFATTVEPVGTGTTLCQHHCPVQSLAAEFPQLCEAETAALSRLLGSHVQRLATLAHGDGVCTTHIPSPAPPAPQPRPEGTR